MSAGNFEACLAFTFRAEGYDAYTDDKYDSGGPTRWGITLGTLQTYRRDQSLAAADVASLSRAEATVIYRSMFWDGVRGNELPAGVDLSVYDHGVPSGPTRSIRILQAALGGGLARDGVLGPLTLTATLAADPRDLIGRLYDRQAAFYKQLRNPRYERGWLNRAAARRDDALRML